MTKPQKVQGVGRLAGLTGDSGQSMGVNLNNITSISHFTVKYFTFYCQIT
jgi:hypothetical protein